MNSLTVSDLKVHIDRPLCEAMLERGSHRKCTSSKVHRQGE